MAAGDGCERLRRKCRRKSRPLPDDDGSGAVGIFVIQEQRFRYVNTFLAGLFAMRRTN
jgi:hypothetical protein